MALKFRLRGLAETFIEEIRCPGCQHVGGDEESFSTEHTRVTFDGIIVVVRCKQCDNVFVPDQQRLGVINPSALRAAVEKDSQETGEPVFDSMRAVKLAVERDAATDRDDVH
jgi:hypothetical protein